MSVQRLPVRTLRVGDRIVTAQVGERAVHTVQRATGATARTIGALIVDTESGEVTIFYTDSDEFAEQVGLHHLRRSPTAGDRTWLPSLAWTRRAALVAAG